MNIMLVDDEMLVLNGIKSVVEKACPEDTLFLLFGCSKRLYIKARYHGGCGKCVIHAAL